MGLKRTVADPPNATTVLVTGINGYISSTIVLQLLQAGYRVHGTVRRPESVKSLLEGPLKSYVDLITVFEVPDMTADGAFDEAVKGVSGIIHTASPLNFSLTEVDAFIKPAVKGSETLLASALDHAGPQLTSIVVTSSFLGVLGDQMSADPRYVFTEADWNELSGRVVEEKGNDADSVMMYAASKVAAERAIWAFRSSKKPPFSIAVCNPGFVFGPPLQLPETTEQLNETLSYVWMTLSGKAKTMPPEIALGAFIDVRDVARAHIWCFEHPMESDGQRYLLACGQGRPQAMVDILHIIFPGRSAKMVKGEPGKDYDASYGWWKEGPRIDDSKASKAMGIDWIRFDRSLGDTAKALAERWLS